LKKIADIMLDDQPENENELASAIRIYLEEKKETEKENENEIITASEAIYSEMLNLGFIPSSISSGEKNDKIQI